jgi:thiamine pyridinylase
MNNQTGHRSWKELRAMVPKASRLLVSDFDGSWTIPAMYLNSYVQTYGYANIQNAFTAPIDPAVIQNLNTIAAACNGDDGNPCIDGRYHNAPDGTVEKVFATQNAYLEIGFSERSFFVLLYQTVGGYLIAVPAEWGDPYMSTLLLYTDAFVTNRSTCTSGYCPADSQAFTTLMTSSAMKSYIAFSQDLPAGTPPRHLLVATQPFWNLSSVQNDPLYQQFATIFGGQTYSIQPFPNWFTPAQKQTMYGGVCDALKVTFPNYACAGTIRPAAH